MKLLILSILVAAFLFSCSVSKKNERAVNRVKADINLLNDVGDAWQQLHPCVGDTVHEFINGKEVVRYDTLYNSYVDTLYSIDTQTKIVYKTIEKVVSKVDTLKIYVIDNRAERQAQNDLSKAQGQIVQLQTDKKESDKTGKERLFWMIGEGLAIVGLTILLFKK